MTTSSSPRRPTCSKGWASTPSKRLPTPSTNSGRSAWRRKDEWHMRKPYYIYILFFSAILILNIFPLQHAQKAAQRIPLLRVNREYDKRTIVKTSTIPHAGNGLFAAVKIKKGEVIGELGGRLVSDDDSCHGNHYIASISECAWEKTHPYKYIDSKDYGGEVRRNKFLHNEVKWVGNELPNS